MSSESQTVRRDRRAGRRETRVFCAILLAATVVILFAAPALSRMWSDSRRQAAAQIQSNTDTTTTLSGGRGRTADEGASDRVPSGTAAAPAPSGGTPRGNSSNSAAPGTTPTSAAMRIVVPAAFRPVRGT